MVKLTKKGTPRVKTGRKSILTPETLEKLKLLFVEGLSDQDACNFVGIHSDTLYKYCRANPNFSREKEALKRSPFMNSLLVINKAIKEGDINTAKWYAERKGKDEFSTRQEVDLNDEPERKFSTIKLINGKKIIELK